MLWGELDRATQPFGLATTGGLISHTGDRRPHARRRPRPPDAQARPDRRQPALRRPRDRRRRARCTSTPRPSPSCSGACAGGGGNFGIATAFEYRLHPVGPLVLGGPIFWPLADAPEVLRFLRDFAPEAPDELGITLSMMLAPPLPFLPPRAVRHAGPRPRARLGRRPRRGRAGDRAAARGSARRSPTPCARRRTSSLQSMLDGGAPHGRHYYWKSHRLPALSDDGHRRLHASAWRRCTSPFSQINGWAMGGAVSRVDPDATAVGEREVGFDISFAAGWPPADPDGERHTAWVARGLGGAARRTAPASTRTSSPTRAPPASGPPTATASRA